MLSVADALALILADAPLMPVEAVPLAEAYGRVLAEDVAAKLTQPPFASSSMDGYALRRADIASMPRSLAIIGESAAGHPFDGQVGPGEAVRIFTGAAVPDGADCVVIQENVDAESGEARIRETDHDDYIRPRGGDFSEGDVLLRAGKRLSARDLMLAAQMNHAALPVRRRPKVAVLASGDELLPPGSVPEAGQIISSIPSALGPMLRGAGADAMLLGIARDTLESLAAHIEKGRDADILVTIGGASVGDHDLVRAGLENAGFSIGFHKVAIRPGKPIMSGARPGQRVLGLPGNPVSAVMCSLVFVMPLIAAMLGETEPPSRAMQASLAAALPANGPRQHYMRARFVDGGMRAVETLPSQDSSLTAALAAADCLIVRPPNAPAASAGDPVNVLPFNV
jgi:molybdopterin molybdotransferase